MYYGGPDQEASEGNNIIKWARYNSWPSLEKSVAAFRPCSKNLPEAK